MRLYYSPASPFVRKVLFLLKETGQEHEVELVPVAGSPVSPGTMPIAENPLGKIPALALADGQVLYDSRVICQYLDHRAGGGHYPDPPRRWKCLTLEAMADGLLDASILLRYENLLRPEPIRLQSWIDGQMAKIDRALDAAETGWIDYLEDQPKGPPDMGKVALGCALGYLDFRFAGYDWRDKRPALAAWEAVFRAIPGMQATIPADPA